MLVFLVDQTNGKDIVTKHEFQNFDSANEFCYTMECETTYTFKFYNTFFIGIKH